MLSWGVSKYIEAKPQTTFKKKNFQKLQNWVKFSFFFLFEILLCLHYWKNDVYCLC